MPNKQPTKYKSGEVIQRCSMCEKVATKTSLALIFYKSYSKFQATGRVPICKDCIKSYSVRKKRVDSERLIEILKYIDRPYHPMLLESSAREVLDAKQEKAIRKEWELNDIYAECGEEVVAHYFKNLGMNQYKGETFSHSTFKEDETEDGSKLEFNVDEIKELKKKYGGKYEDEDYVAFENRYNRILPSYPIRTDLHMEALIAYVVPKCLYEKALSINDMGNADKFNKFANEAMKAGKLNVSSLSKSDVTGGVELLAQLFEAVELENGPIDIIPEMLEKPDDSIDLAIHSILSYGYRLEGKPAPTYKEIYSFYDEQLEEFFESKGWDEKRRQEYRDERSASYRNLVEVYEEPLYEDEKKNTVDGDI